VVPEESGGELRDSGCKDVKQVESNAKAADLVE
jgi:hypothetical protein